MGYFRWCLLIVSAVPLGLGSTVLSIDAPEPRGCSLFLWEDEGEDRNREMERSTNLCGAGGAASHFLCSMSRAQTCLWATLTKIVGCVYSCNEAIASGTIVLPLSFSRRGH